MEAQAQPRIDIEHLTISRAHPPVFIGEIGINHNGAMNLAHALIDAASEAGADVVKFQTHIPEAEMLPTHPLWDVLSQAALSLEQHMQLKEHAEANGLVFLSTPFSIMAVDLLEQVGVSAYKTGSGELTHLPLQALIAQMGKPTIISTGMSTLAEVQATVGKIYRINQQLILMNCTSTYPTLISDARITRIQALQALFPSLLVGQSDHTPTISSALAAIALGAVVIEKHFTLDKRLTGPDHASSLNPAEFEELTIRGREVWESVREGSGDDNGLEAVKLWAEHSMVTGIRVKERETVSIGTLAFKRTGQSGGIPASKWDQLSRGQYHYAKDLPANHPLKPSDVRPRPE